MTTAIRGKEAQESLEKREFWWWAEKARSSRVDYLRKAVWSKASKGSTYLPGTKMCIHGLKVYKEVWSEPEARTEPYMFTWAKAQAEVFDTIPIFIIDNARIVGYVGSAPNKFFWTPAMSYSLNDDTYNDRSGLIEEGERDTVKECIDFLRPVTFQAMTERYLSRRQRIMAKTSQTFTGAKHLEAATYCTSQFDYYIKGFNNIIADIDKKLAEAEEFLYGVGSIPDFNKEYEYLKKLDNWKAMKMVLEAAVRWARRYSRLAKIIAENFETDPVRKQELMEISQRCWNVPAEAPETFAESLQFEHFQSMGRKYEMHDGAWPTSPDRWFWPYYKKEVLEEKSLTREDALDYVAEYLIRAYEYGSFRDRQYRELMTGDPGPYVWTFGGVWPDGSDACSDLTDLFMEAARLVRVVSPTFAFRYHRNCRVQTLKQVFECIRHGLGYPNMRHDEVLIASNMYWSGTPLEEARTWNAQACIVPCPNTRHGVMPARYSSSATLGSKCVELALWNGYNPIFKMQIGPKTGDPTRMTFDELFDASVEQYRVIHWEACKIRNMTRFVEEIKGRPYLSATYEECVETGLNAFQKREYGNNWLTIFIWMDGWDALAALKKLVYDDKKYSMEQVLKMLAANWEGYETERMDFVHAPKWGNDDDTADEIIVRAYKDVRDKVLLPCRCWGTRARGIPGVPQNIAAYSVAGILLGALPNGRRLGDTCYDGGCSPGAGLDRKGPTAVLRSVGKLDHTTMFRANLLNQRLSPTQLAGDKGFDLWHNYIKTWHDLGINHVQFNMIDNETLVAAQKEPEKYNELIVRVAGYSACFVELNKKTQDTIIARTVQTL